MADDVRLAEFWDALKTRLDTTRMRALLGGAGRIYKATEDFADAEGPESGPWARLVIIPASTIWPVITAPGYARRVAWMLRAEVNNFSGGNFDPIRTLEGVHDEAYKLLEYWTPAGFDDLLVVVHVYRAASPQSMPFWDEPRMLWLMSAEYRMEAGATAATAP